MNNKELSFSSEARAQLKEGLDTLADAVKVTLGPAGRNVLLQKNSGPHITKDGVSVAKEIQLDNHFTNMGAQLVKEVSQKTADEAGDGTTTATVLAQAMAKRGFELVNEDVNPVTLKRGMDKAVKMVVDELEKQVVNVGDKVEQIATISANGDSKIGELISDAFNTVGKDGVITVEESKGLDTYMEVVDGMQFDKGYLSTHFSTNSEKMQAELDNPYILLYDGRISNMNDILPLLEAVAQTSKPLVIIADDVEGEVLGTLVVNKLRGALNVCAVKAPSFGDRKKEMMNDIATVTGGTFITNEVGHKLEEVGLEMLGVAEKMVVTKDNTTIVNGAGSAEDIADRVQLIKNQIEASQSEYEQEKMQERLAKLSGGVAVLYIGAGSEVELKEKKDRVDDSLQATKAAIEEGIVEGGGIALLRALMVLNETEFDVEDTDGVSVIKDALSAPTEQILENAGLNSASIIEEIFKNWKSDKLELGYNVKSNQFVDMIADGVIDPKKVTRTTIQNASSVVGMILTTECMVVDKVDKDKNEPPQQQMLMG